MSLHDWADSLSLLGSLVLTWPALRAGRVLGRAARMAEEIERTDDPIARKIQWRLKKAYTADTWRPSDQRWLWIGLVLTILGAFLELLAP